MSVIHWDKSVLTLHLREVLEDHQRGNSQALVGLGAVLVGAIAIPATAKLGKPVLKNIVKTGLRLTHPQRLKG
jgi:hypothetical protein